MICLFTHHPSILYFCRSDYAISSLQECQDFCPVTNGFRGITLIISCLCHYDDGSLPSIPPAGIVAHDDTTGSGPIASSTGISDSACYKYHPAQFIGCPPAFDSSSTYEAGDKVEVNDLAYECKSWPESAHCSQTGFEPDGAESSSAWTVLGHCEGELGLSYSCYDSIVSRVKLTSTVLNPIFHTNSKEQLPLLPLLSM